MTAVTELHLHGRSTRSSGEQLVTQADTEDWHSSFLDVLLNVLDSLLHHCWVTGTVGDEQTIVLLACKSREVVVPWHLNNLDTSVDEASQLVVLKTDIDSHDSDGTS